MDAGGPIPGGLSAQLWSEALPQVAQALLHPFVIALAQGTLPRQSFSHYVAQDAFFLHHFAAAYAAAIDKVDASPTSGSSATTRSVLQHLLMGVHAELRLHGGFAAQWGVSLAQLAQPSPATLAYTDFLRNVAEDPETSVGEVLAAMVPCSRLYAYLGCQLARSYIHLDHAYSSWVQMYSGATYGALPRMKESLLDNLGGTAPYERLKQLYCRAMDLEVAFFSAQPQAPPPRQLSLLVCDFDDTCSQSDTIGTLMGLAVTAAERAAPSPEAAAEAKERVQKQIKWLAANYAAKHKVLIDEILQPQAGAVRGVTEFDMEILAGFLDKLSVFDVSMNQVVIDSGILAGLDMADVREAGKQLQLQEGCRETLNAVAAAGIPVRIMSVNWSASFVAAALGPNAGIALRPESPAASKQSLLVHANELELASCTAAERGSATAAAAAATEAMEPSSSAAAAPALTTGNLVRSVECAMDKGRLFEELLLAEASCAATGHAAGDAGGASSSGAGSERPVSVYVGDSTSDVLPLLAADYGIIIGSNQLLRRVAQAFGIQIQPLTAAPLQPPAAASEPDAPPVLYEAADWHQVRAFLLGPQQGVTQGGSGRDATAASLPAVLTVAGSDSGGGAGIQADLKTFLARGVFGMSVITALTAQNTKGVEGVHQVPADFIAAQLDSVLGDIGAQALKTGMLPSAEAVSVLAAKIRQYGITNVVVDPVMISTSGHALASGGVAEAMARQLLPLATVVTPNLAEASVLLGGRPINTLEDMRAAAAELHAAHGPKAVLVKGGHLAAQQAAQEGASAADIESVDVLYDGQEWHELRAPYVATGNSHGTGCTLASAIAAELAKGANIREAAAAAKAYLTAALQGSRGMALGSGPQRPFDHGAASSSQQQQQQLPTQQHNNQQVVQRTQSSFSQPQPGCLGIGQPNPVDLRAYAVTDPGCNAASGRSLTEAVRAAVAGGATIVQLREKDTEGGDFLAAARAALQVCRAAGVPLLINDRVDVALAAGADGVHVGQSDLPARVVRKMLGPNAILGVSVKSVEQAVKAQADGADYLGAGAVFPTGTKDSSVIGLDGLAAICSAVDIPVVAIGGVGAANAEQVVAAGAAGAAVVSAVFAAADPAAAAADLLRAVDGALAAKAGAAGGRVAEAPAEHEEELVAVSPGSTR